MAKSTPVPLWVLECPGVELLVLKGSSVACFWIYTRSQSDPKEVLSEKNWVRKGSGALSIPEGKHSSKKGP